MAQRIQIDVERINPRKIGLAAEVIQKGGTLIYPTDTTYALGCSIMKKKAIEEVYRLRRLPKDQKLSFLCADLSDIARYAIVDDATYRVMKRLIPGPYTFVLRATKEVPKLLLHKRKMVGIRVPNHPATQQLLRALDAPLLTTTVKYDDEVMTDPDDIIHRYREADALLDAGVEHYGESTVLDVSDGTIEVIREGIGPIDFL